MDFTEVVRRRRMVRRYTDHPVDPDAVDRILDAARRAPSAGFSQGQRFVVVTDRERRWAIAGLAGESRYRDAGFEPWLSVAPVHIVVCATEGAYRERYAEPDKRTGSGVDAWPVPYWWVDAGAALMVLLLAAVDEGLAAGFLGAHAVTGIEELLGIPGDVAVIGVVTVGHPADDRRSGSLDRGRRPWSEVVHHEHWSSSSTVENQPAAPHHHPRHPQLGET